jgi:cytochrome c-type biogenesis protein CcmH/NrfF
MRSVVLLAGLLLALAAPAWAQQARTGQTEADRAISQLRSPYCPGLMLEVCPSPDAAVLRDSIRDLAAEGMGAAELIEWMIAGHGEEWRAVPQRSGRGIWAWVIPPLFLLAGGGLVVSRLRADRERAAAAPRPPASTLSSDDRERLALAMREWERTEGEDA